MGIWWGFNHPLSYIIITIIIIINIIYILLLFPTKQKILGFFGPSVGHRTVRQRCGEDAKGHQLPLALRRVRRGGFPPGAQDPEKNGNFTRKHGETC